MAEGRTLIRGLPTSRTAWNGDDDCAERARLHAAWSTYMTEVDRALTLITRKEVAR